MQIQSLDELGTEKEIKVFGKTTALKFQRLKILLIGLTQLGLEITKHVALQQPEIITLCDPINAPLADNLIKSITQVTQVNILNFDYKNEEILKQIAKHDLIIISDIWSKSLALTISNSLRTQDDTKKSYTQGVIWTCVFGFACVCFSDFGEGFKIYDRDGEQPFPFHISNISQDAPGIVTIDKSIPHNYHTGDYVCLHEVDGMTEVNGNEPRPIKVLNELQFTIENTKQFKKYLQGGLVQLAKVPQRFKFKPFAETFAQFNDSSVYATILGILENDGNTDNVIEFVKKYNNNIDLELVHKTLKQVNVQRFPVINFWAGVCSLEVIKFTGKFTPNECLFKEFISDIEINDSNLKEELSKLDILIIGCGGTGCELVRQFATMECCNVPEHKITLLDDDIVRRYTLMSHFWFKEKQIGKQKGKVGNTQEQGWQICQNMNIELNHSKLSESSEEVIKSHSYIFSAINNQASRVLIQQLAQNNNKCLFDQILNGLKAFTQIQTAESNLQMTQEDTLRQVYNVNKETYKKFPYLPLHCVLWAKDVFENSFVGFVSHFKKFVSDPKGYVQNCQECDFAGNSMLKAHIIWRISKPDFNLTLDKILSLSKELFEYHFEYKIVELLKKYPNDDLNNVWTGYKREPEIIKFNSNDGEHVSYVQITTILISKIFGINSSQVLKAEFVIDKLHQMTDNYWSLNKMTIPTEYEIQQRHVPQYLNFDEDQIRGLYVRCIHSLANLRAKNYGIKLIPLHKVQKYALEINRSNPMMHCIIVGWMGIELLKILYKNSKHRNMHVDINKNVIEFL